MGGKCGELGCDSTHACNNGCCDSGQCVTANGCSGDVKCGADGTCPARCDTASNGKGCNSGCCDTSSGVCGDGTANAACGNSGSACVACANGITCESQVCKCSNFCPNGLACDPTGVACQTSCTPDTATGCAGSGKFCVDGSSCLPLLAIGSACAADGDCTSAHCDCSAPDCSTRVCTAGCPVCTAAEPPGAANPGACDSGNLSPAGATPFNCNATSGGCLGGACACNASGTCSNANAESCREDDDCASAHCACTDPSCTPALRVCAAAPCGSCNYIDGTSGSCGTGATDAIAVGTNTVDCTTTSGCTTPPCTCSGSGSCGTVDGHSCTASSHCASGHCDTLVSTGSGNGICSEVPCFCGYLDGTETTCQGPITKDESSLDCEGDEACDGAYHCKGLTDAPCANNSQCLSDFPDCDCMDSTCSRKTCQPLNCGGVCYYVNPDDDCANACCPVAAGTSCGTIPGSKCDGAGNCGIPVVGL